MQFGKDAPLYAYEVSREGGEDVMYVNFVGAPFVPSIVSMPEIMERVVDLLIDNQNVSRVVFVQSKNYNYDLQETNYLLEVANFYTFLLKQERILSQDKFASPSEAVFSKRYNSMFSFLSFLKSDPIFAYHELRRFLIEAKIDLERVGAEGSKDFSSYVHYLEKLIRLFEKIKIISAALPYVRDFQIGNREIYHRLFKPDVIPNFTFTRLVFDLPDDSEIVDQYKVGKDHDESLVTILKKQDEAKFIYHLSPPENSLSEEFNSLLNLARGTLMEHQPKAKEFTDTDRIRQVFFNISKDLLSDLANSKGIQLSYLELNRLSTILVRHTIGFGLLEVLLQDKHLQDISLNAPIPKVNIFVRHGVHGECSTNILPSSEDADSWAAKFRMISGRPLNEANPILDTQLSIGKISARIAIIQEPLSPEGLAYSIRRHREDPWTLPLFIRNKMLNPLSAGLLSFLIDGARTMLVAGTRSSGKTSLLGSLMLEIIPKNRIIVIEDTLELPVPALRNLNYDILRMKVRSALLKTTTEVSAEDGIRTSLRLGDSCLILGEVRSEEAKALYEAMRVGALANVVAGTIHGASPYGVYDRVVNDLNVPKTSFKATDIIAVANPIKSPDGMHSWRRLLQISEVRKHWTNDPMEEKGFVDLMKYNVEKDEILPTDDLINGDSEIIKDIASNVKGWAGNWDAVYDNILLRSKIKKELVDVATKIKDDSILEAKFSVVANDAFHKFSDTIIQEIGIPSSERVFPVWQEWLNKKVKAKKF